jgi:hypothetical protein
MGMRLTGIINATEFAVFTERRNLQPASYSFL